MEAFDKIKDKFYDELDEIGNQKQFSMDDLCLIDKITDIWVELCKIEMFEENDVNQFMEDFSRDNGYSTRANSMRRYYNDNSYNDGMSYNGNSYGSSHGVGYRTNNRRGGYSRDDGMKENIVKKLEMFMKDSRDEHDRDAINRIINEIKQQQ